MQLKRDRLLQDKLLQIETHFTNINQQLEIFSQRYDEKSRQQEDILRKLAENLVEKQTLANENQQKNHHGLQKAFTENMADSRLQQQRSFNDFKQQIQTELAQQRSEFDKRQIEGIKTLQESLQNQMGDVRTQLSTTLNQNAEYLSKSIEKLTGDTNTRLKEISGHVERRLAEGFEKTTATFTDVIKRLALIDEAQKKITELSTNVVSLQEILSDKRSRGAFGEVQLSALIRNLMPESTFAFQYTLSNEKRADCILFLPEPTGNVVIDAKFPLESYRKITDNALSEIERRQSEQQFRIDIRKHIKDIADKYIIADETADGAIMFIPAEAIFAEIHAHYPELVESAQKARVWMTSPTTMMAILTTARAVLKDEDTRKQVHVIQEHLGYLAKDFDRFQKRMNNLARHIEQANDDVKAVNTSAKKITHRFQKIEKVELDDIDENNTLELLE